MTNLDIFQRLNTSNFKRLWILKKKKTKEAEY